MKSEELILLLILSSSVKHQTSFVNIILHSSSYQVSYELWVMSYELCTMHYLMSGSSLTTHNPYIINYSSFALLISGKLKGVKGSYCGFSAAQGVKGHYFCFSLFEESGLFSRG